MALPPLSFDRFVLHTGGSRRPIPPGCNCADCSVPAQRRTLRRRSSLVCFPPISIWSRPPVLRRLRSCPVPIIKRRALNCKESMNIFQIQITEHGRRRKPSLDRACRSGAPRRHSGKRFGFFGFFRPPTPDFSGKTAGMPPFTMWDKHLHWRITAQSVTPGGAYWTKGGIRRTRNAAVRGPVGEVHLLRFRLQCLCWFFQNSSLSVGLSPKFSESFVFSMSILLWYFTFTVCRLAKASNYRFQTDRPLEGMRWLLIFATTPSSPPISKIR